MTDSKRLQQVLKNLLSNAFKFTGEGGVKLTVSAAVGGWSAEHPILNNAPAVVAFEVSDTGIGIPLEKQKLIFEAFQQADAGTSRKYGGTGLGLAISRELANLLGGEIHLRSAPGKGSTFTLYLPLKYSGPTVALRVPPPLSSHATAPSLQAAATQERVVVEVADDRLNLEPGDTILLIVEDDPHYARVLVDLARDKGFKVLVANRGTEALDLAKQFQPAAVSLDVFLPDMLGWTRAEPAQAQSADAAHSRADHHARRGPAARAGARRVLVRQQADDDRGRQRGACPDQGICQDPDASGC